MAIKPHKPKVRIVDSAYVLDYYPIPEPDEKSYSHAGKYNEDFDSWKKSKQTVIIYEHHVKDCIELARNISTQKGNCAFEQELKLGIEISPDDIEISRIFDGNKSITDYAFIKKAVEHPELSHPNKIDLKSAEKKFDEILSSQTKEDYEQWLQHDNNRQKFYEYGESLGIKINDLQRLAIILNGYSRINEPFKNFWLRLEMFVENVQVNDAMSEQEKDMILNICKQQQKIK